MESEAAVVPRSKAHELNQHSRLGKNFAYLTFAIILLFGLIQITWGEKIPIQDGLGWDGAIYADMTREFPQNVLRKLPSPNRLQRIFPEAVVNLGLRVLGLQMTNRNIIKGFEVYNFALLLISCIIWNLLSSTLGVSDRSKWLGFCLLFINFPVLKFNFYYPVLTDTTAFALGLWLAYCFLTRNSLGILLVLIIASFTWPTLFFSGILLYLFPNINSGIHPSITPARRKLNTVVAIGVSIVVLAAAIYLHYGMKLPTINGTDRTNDSLILISLAAVAAYIFASLRHLLDLDDLFNLKALPHKFILRGLMFFIIIMVSAALVGGVIVRGIHNHALTSLYDKIVPVVYAGFLSAARPVVYGVFLYSVAKPAIFLIAHVVYFGPVALIFLYYFPSFCRIIHRHGIGLTLFFVGTLLLALDSESRHLIHAFPFVVILVTMFMDTLSWKSWQGWVILAICLLFSKVWLPINGQALTGDYLAFPFQYYFMNHGPWMSTLSYAIQTSVVILTAGFLYLVFLRRVWPSNSVFSGSGKMGLLGNRRGGLMAEQ